MENDPLQSLNQRSLDLIADGSSTTYSPALDPLALSSSPPTREGFCDKCSGLNLHERFSRKTPDNATELFIDLACSVEQLKASTCPLCRLFASVAPSDVDSEGLTRSSTCLVMAFSAIGFFAKFGLKKASHYDATLLGVVRSSIQDAKGGLSTNLRRSLEETGGLCFASPNEDTSRFGARQISASVYDQRFAGGCVEYCRLNHGEACKPPDTNPLVCFRVIDCKNRVLVDAPKSCSMCLL